MSAYNDITSLKCNTHDAYYVVFHFNSSQSLPGRHALDSSNSHRCATQ